MPLLKKESLENQVQETEVKIDGLEDNLPKLLKPIKEKKERSYALLSNRTNFVRKIEELNNKIRITNKEKNLLDVLKMQELINTYEKEILKIEDELIKHENNVSEKEVKNFRVMFSKEYKLIDQEHNKILEEIDEKLKEVYDLFNKKAIIERMGARRTNRMRYVKEVSEVSLNPATLDLTRSDVFIYKDKNDEYYINHFKENIEKESRKVFREYYDKNLF